MHCVQPGAQRLDRKEVPVSPKEGAQHLDQEEFGAGKKGKGLRAEVNLEKTKSSHCDETVTDPPP